MFNDDFIDFMGYRYTVVEDKIEECLQQIRSGETEFSIDRDDLTEEEVEYIEREVQKRIESSVSGITVSIKRL